jgi:starch synthase
VVHCNDWQTALVPALLEHWSERPASVFTVHNLRHLGLFEAETFARLKLPGHLWGVHGLEFYGQCCLVKGGLGFADWLTTVSPGYAQEIQTQTGGQGLDGLLRERAQRLRGILNGLDTTRWDPRRDPLINAMYTPEDLDGKLANKLALQRQLGLPEAADVPLAAFSGGITKKAGVDLLLEVLPELMRVRSLQLVVLGRGDPVLERRLGELAAGQAGSIQVRSEPDDPLAHLVAAGADLLLMPSRFEPCGEQQIIGLRYGTVPVVRRVGGLADTVVNLDQHALAQGTATGFVFEAARPQDLYAALRWALACYHHPSVWQRLMRAGMAQDFGWGHTAARYLELYERAAHEQRMRIEAG